MPSYLLEQYARPDEPATTRRSLMLRFRYVASIGFYIVYLE